MSKTDRSSGREPQQSWVPQVSHLKPGNPRTPTSPIQPENPVQGPSLTLLYSLLALALAAAIGFALLIVLPFYQRR